MGQGNSFDSVVPPQARNLPRPALRYSHSDALDRYPEATILQSTDNVNVKINDIELGRFLGWL